MEGVTAFIQKEDDGKLRLVLNDVIATSTGESPDWRHNVLFTSNTYDENLLKKFNLSNEQYAEIGQNLIMWLLVIGGFLK